MAPKGLMFAWGTRERPAGRLAPCRVLAALLAVALMRAPSAGAAGVVGIGSAASCTEDALDAALAEGGMVTFDCGSEPVTLAISGTKAIVHDTTIDGGGRVTIDGDHKWQVFTVDAGITVAVQNLTIANGNDGGGIANIGTLTVINSTFSGNIATYGGGIANNGTLTVTNSTLSGNIATNFGGGMLAGCLSGAPCHPTTLTLTNSIISGNDGGDCFNFSSGTITDGGHNLIGPVSCGLVNGVNRNIVGIAPLLDPDGLKDNGGPTLTIALCTGMGQPHPDCRATSPAIDAADTAQLLPTDQRGAPRPYGAAGDIGAVESGGLPWVCDGSCRIDSAVTVDELLTMVKIALGTTAVFACTAGDRNQDAAITVDEILVGLHNALHGCPGPPPPKPTYTSTPATVTPTPGPSGKKIMMLGDSITNGGCYAPFLYEDVRTGGYASATFVGTCQWPPVWGSPVPGRRTPRRQRTKGTADTRRRGSSRNFPAGSCNWRLEIKPRTSCSYISKRTTSGTVTSRRRPRSTTMQRSSASCARPTPTSRSSSRRSSRCSLRRRRGNAPRI